MTDYDGVSDTMHLQGQPGQSHLIPLIYVDERLEGGFTIATIDVSTVWDE
jgi:hypothetical protein